MNRTLPGQGGVDRGPRRQGETRARIAAICFSSIIDNEVSLRYQTGNLIQRKCQRRATPGDDRAFWDGNNG